MPITFTCDCGKQLRVKDELAGKRVKCPACAGGVTVPEPEPEFEVVDEAPPPKPAPRPAPKPAARPAPEPEFEVVDDDPPRTGKKEAAYSIDDDEDEKPARKPTLIKGTPNTGRRVAEEDDRPRSRRRDDDEDDDRPRKRRDEDDDRPARSRRRDEDEDDRPARRRRDDDDDRPRKKKAKKKRKASSSGGVKWKAVWGGLVCLVIGLGLSAVLFFLDRWSPYLLIVSAAGFIGMIGGFLGYGGDDGGDDD
jgi:hypothetical protein